jgi:hypothetical protein
MNKDTLYGQIHIFLRPVPPALLLVDSSGRVARELWWTKKKHSPVDIIPPRFTMFICHFGDD